MALDQSGSVNTGSLNIFGIPGGYEENRVGWMWKDSENFLGRTFDNSMEVRLGHNLATGDG